MKKNILQIKAEVVKLVTIKPKVLERSVFGDNHHDAIEAQIEVMEKDLSEDDIYELSNDGTEDECNEDKWPDNVKDAALEARHWMDGELKISPSKSWKPLIQK